MNKKAIITTLFAVILGLASCNRDSNYEDKVEQVTVYVSAETGMFYNVPNTTLANPPQDSGKYRYELVRIVSDKENGKA